jgi:hypothetical protein
MIIKNSDGVIQRTFVVDFNGLPFSPEAWNNYAIPSWREIVEKCVYWDAILIVQNFRPQGA